jgi:hypothetical protein
MKYQKCRRHGEPKNVKQHERHERIDASVELMQKEKREKMVNNQKAMMQKTRKMRQKKWKMNLQKMKL